MSLKIVRTCAAVSTSEQVPLLHFRNAEEQWSMEIWLVTNRMGFVRPLPFDRLFHGNPSDAPYRLDFMPQKDRPKGRDHTRGTYVHPLNWNLYNRAAKSAFGREPEPKPQSNTGQRWRRFKFEV